MGGGGHTLRRGEGGAWWRLLGDGIEAVRAKASFFPVRDSVVTERLLGLGRSYETDWAVYKQLVLDRNRQRLLTRIIELTSDQLGFKITDPHLRVLDVILWATAPSELRNKRW